MPEYLAPGVYVEETSFRAKSIEGVGTSTTAFAGPTRKGPVASPEALPEILTSYADFERIYGGFANLQLAPSATPDAINHLAHAVRAYFNEGGSRLYVARVYMANGAATGLATSADLRIGAGLPAESDANRIRFAARFPGAAATVRNPPTSSRTCAASRRARSSRPRRSACWIVHPKVRWCAPAPGRSTTS